MKPTYKHDCQECQFVGHVNGVDWYVHPPTTPTSGCVIGRYGDEGAENRSYPIHELKNRGLASTPGSNKSTAVYVLHHWETNHG